MNTLIKNAYIITMNKSREIIENGFILVEENKIKDMGKNNDLPKKYEKYNIYDARGKVIIPGLINTHTHLFQGLLKGLGDDRNLVDWFREVTGPSAVNLEPEDCYIAAKLGVLESILSGVTTLFDFMYPHHRKGLSEPIINAIGESGIRGIYGRGYIDYGVKYGIPKELLEDYNEVIEDVENLYNKYNNSYQGRIKIWLTPSMIWSQTKEGLEEIRKFSRSKNIPVAIHVSETPFERENAKTRFGKNDLDFLESINFLGPDTLAIHCVHLNERDLRILKYYDVKVSYNPVSNMYLSSGVAPIPSMLKSGITVGLATDGSASNNNQNMIQSLKFASLLQKVDTLDPTVITAEKVFEMATIDAARAIGLENEIGSIEKNKKADLVILNFNNPFSIPNLHPISALVYSGVSNEVESVMVNGKFILKENKLLSLVSEEILIKAQNKAKKLAERANTSHLRYRPWRQIAF